ncbi:MAG: glycosyltransferase family 2 protein [Bacteroidales bacterium]|nr:glycosyltransferase family 2 protein [Bacteroidales bacterium]
MIWIGWVFMVFGLIRLAISFHNFISRPYLPEPGNNTFIQPEISVLIPARNEEENIGLILSDLSSDDTGIKEIIVYDDNSTDETTPIVHKWSESNPKIKLISGHDLPENWMGKNFACYNLAKEAKGKYLLFLDADVRIRNKAVIRALSYLSHHKIKLLSVFPQQIMPNRGTYLVVPLMNWILLSLLPLTAVRKIPQPSLSAANGQFMFFDAETYKKLQPHKKVKRSAIEDMKIVRYYKRKKIKVAVLLGYDDVQCKMYHNLDEAVEGFSKNFFEFFGGSQFLCYLFAIITTIAPWVILALNGISAAVIYIIIVLLIRILISVTSKQSAKFNILNIVSQQFILWRIILNASKKKKKKNLLWKGRNIY